MTIRRHTIRAVSAIVLAAILLILSPPAGAQGPSTTVYFPMVEHDRTCRNGVHEIVFLGNLEGVYYRVVPDNTMCAVVAFYRTWYTGADGVTQWSPAFDLPTDTTLWMARSSNGETRHYAVFGGANFSVRVFSWPPIIPITP